VVKVSWAGEEGDDWLAGVGEADDFAGDDVDGDALLAAAGMLF
jgi:hypothetical protein